MFIIKGVLFLLASTSISILFGNVFLRLLGWERRLSAAYAWGTALLFACVQLIAYPLYRFNTSFTLFFLLFSFVLIGMLGWSIVSAVRAKDFTTYFRELRGFGNNIKKAPILFLISLSVLVFFLVFSFGFYYPTTDDGYYMTRSMEVIRQNSMGINVRFAWLGWSEGELPDYTDASTFVFLISYFSALFGIHVTILSKSFFSFWLFMAHIAAVWTASDAVLEKREHLFEKKVFVLLFYLVFLIFSVKQDSAGNWITGYIWNGKAFLSAFIFPMLTVSCFTLMRQVETLKAKEWLSVIIVLLSGVSVSIVGLNLPIILYFTFGTAFLVITKFRTFSRIWKGAVISILPVLFYAVLSYLFVITGQNDYYEAGTTTGVSWIEQFLEAVDFFQFLLYLFACFYTLLFGSKLQKALLVLSPAILLGTFLNPLLSGFVCRYVTSSLVYWRLWWLFPLYLLPAITVADLFDRLTKGRLQSGLICSILSLLLVSGFEIFRYVITDPEYSIVPYVENVGRLIHVRPELRDNYYGINPATYTTARAVEQDWDEEGQPSMLMFFNRPFEIRQYSPDIVMAVGIRDIQLNDKLISGTTLTTREFMNTYSQITDGKLLRNILETLNVNYICFEEHSAIENLETFGFRHIQYFSGIDLWRVK